MVVSAWIAERALRFASEAGITGGTGGLALKEFSSRFRAMVFLGDVISVGGTVRDEGPDGVTLELQARNQKGEITTTGVARFGRG